MFWLIRTQNLRAEKYPTYHLCQALYLTVEQTEAPVVKDLLIFIPLVSGKLKLCSQTKASTPTAISHLAGLGPFLPTDCSYACASSSGEILLNSCSSSKCFHMRYLMQASTQGSVRLTLDHVTGFGSEYPSYPSA